MIDWELPFSKIEIGKGEQLKEGSEIAVLGIGAIINNCLEAISTSLAPEKTACFDLRFIKPLDENLLHSIFKNFKVIITAEDGVIYGGFGSSICEFASRHHYTNKIEILGVPDVFPEHGTTNELQGLVGISSEKICKIIELYA
jgi:1-deoxy-D-xylulose-5-phosphate synthase